MVLPPPGDPLMAKAKPASDPIVARLARVLMHDIRHAKERGGFPPVGEAFDFLAFALANSRRSYAQLAQDLWVLFETGEQRGGYFVEFGAGDGVLLSNTCLLEREYHWRGVLAEPNPVFHDALRRNRRAHVSTRCITGTQIGEVRFNQTADPHLSTMDSYSASDGHARVRARGHRITVPAQTLMELLQEARAPRRIDYLSIDTEGSEYDVLDAFDFTAYDVRMLTVEHNHTEQLPRLDALLAGHGFERKFAALTDFDAWYVNTRLAWGKPAPAGLWARLCAAARRIRRPDEKA